jgi:amidophosphoribosyltransferase
MEHNDSPHDECGVVAVAAPGQDVARLTFFSLFALQHRGQEAAGIAVYGEHGAQVHKGTGLVNQVFSSSDLDPLVGDLAIGHNRYSTTGSHNIRNVQPYLYETVHGVLGVAHNGNLVNAGELRQELLERGAGLSSSSDTEVMALTLAGSPGDTWEDRLAHAMQRWEGAFSLVVLTADRVLAARDARGFRPLSVARLPEGGFMVASETGALRTVGGTNIREVKPGEIVSLKGQILRSRQAVPEAAVLARCTFEHIYFSRPDAVWDDLSVHEVRQRLGEQLAHESPVDADVVIPVPDSSQPAAIGYSRVSGIEYNEGFTKNRYIGRTFIEPTQSLRKQGVAMKFMTLDENLAGKRVVMIDDSIVRGTTSGPLVKLVREAGATEVHLRITCPPIAHPCHMGVAMGSYDELIAHHLDVNELRDHIGADSLKFLSVGHMMKAVGRDDGYCNACFTGDYPIEIRSAGSKRGFEGVLA